METTFINYAFLQIFAVACFSVFPFFLFKVNNFKSFEKYLN